MKPGVFKTGQLLLLQKPVLGDERAMQPGQLVYSLTVEKLELIYGPGKLYQ